MSDKFAFAQFIGARLLRERDQRSLSVAELARRSGVHEAQIHRIERGDARELPARTLALLCVALGMTMGSFLQQPSTERSRVCR